MSQNRMSVPAWSFAVEEEQPHTIIEIGTNNGGFTCMLGLMAWRHNCTVHSFDTCKAPNEDFLPLSNMLPIKFHQADCFGLYGNLVIEDLIKKPGKVFLLCDGGDKAKEFSHFSTWLKPGDVIAAHDYCFKEEYWPWSEITEEDVSEVVDHLGLEPFMQEMFDVAGWLSYVKR
jgi:hypothetical protein